VVGSPVDGNLGAGTATYQGEIRVNAATAVGPADGLAGNQQRLLRLQAADANNPVVQITSFGANPLFRMMHAAPRFREGKLAAGPTAPLNGESFGALQWFGWNGAAYAAGAAIAAVAGENWGAANNGMAVRFSTTANGATGVGLRLTIGPLGGVYIGAPAGGTGGDMGPGTLNVQGPLYVNGVAVTVP